jgi:hypothetical protein
MVLIMKSHLTVVLKVMFVGVLLGMKTQEIPMIQMMFMEE